MTISPDLMMNAREAVKHFSHDQQAFNLTELGGGRINDTFLIVSGPDINEKFILQRLNRQVFPQPELLMINLRTISDHLDRQLCTGQNEYHEEWQVVRPIRTCNNKDYFIDSDNNFWRALSYVGGASSIDKVPDVAHAMEAGKALGFFHRLLWDLDPELLADTLPGFHVTPGYLNDYDRTLEQPARKAITIDERYCANIIETQRSFCNILEDATRHGLLTVRTIHGDPKLANIMFDKKTGQAVSLVDLDTAKSGLLHYDIGDCLRSCCNPAGDDIENPDDIRFDMEICRALLSGYLAEMAPFLTDADYEFIYPAIKLITFELGLRYFNDYLAGNIYFRADNRDQNLRRAINQFKLMESIDSSKLEICNIVNKLRVNCVTSPKLVVKSKKKSCVPTLDRLTCLA